MIPVSLKIKGLYSYQDEQCIDFSKLTEAHIFGFFGSVGSGKSSILEAITFALYGITDRLNERGDERSYNMLNLRSNELLIDFEFKTGSEENLYRFVATSKRRKRFDDVTSIERKAYQFTKNEWQPLESVDAEKIIGLSYENFKRTIIIPQGKFQEFLQLSSTERTRMLKELFYLDKFEFSDKVAALLSEAKTKLTDLQARIDMLGTISPETIQVIEAELAEMQSQSKRYETNLKGLAEQENAFLQLKKLTTAIKEQTAQLNRLQEQAAHFKQKKEKLEIYEYCFTTYKPLFERKTELLTFINKQENKLNESKVRIHQFEQELEKKYIDENRIKQLLADREIQFKKANELLTVADVLTKIADLEKVKKSNNDGSVLVEKKEHECELLRSTINNLKQKRQEYKKKQPDHTALLQLNDWFNANLQFQKNGTEINGKISLRKQQIASLESSFAEKLAVENCTDLQLNQNGNSVKKQLESSISLLENNQQILNEEHTHLLAFHKLGDFAMSLQHGEACPLCGSLEHLHQFETGNNAEKLQHVQEQLAAIALKLKSLNYLHTEFNQLNTTIQFISTDLDHLSTELEKHNQVVADHHALFKWNNYDKNDPSKVQQEIQQWNELKQQIDGLDEQINKAENDEQEQLKTLEKWKERLQEVKAKNNELEGAIAALSTQLELLRVNDFINDNPPQLRNESALIKEKIASAEQEMVQLKLNIDEIAQQLNQTKGNLSADQEQLHQQQHLLQNLNQQIKQLLENEVQLSELTIIETLNNRLDVAFERKAINEYNLQLNASEEVLTKLKQQAGDKEYNESDHQEIINRINGINLQLEELNRSIGAKAEQCDQLKQNLLELTRLTIENEKLSKRKENLDTLSKLFRSSGFVQYISGVYLQNLCEAANDRFHKLTRQQLSLEIREDNSFAIRDFLNNGQLRHVKTLSGGQTFQAALSLALALADNIQQLTHSSENFFFLDEGFGSLDKESLQVVFDTLKSLRKENRMVGVISHVEEMQQEIEVYLKIINDPEKGSRITKSWEN
ncbi:AAA family ATPase [Solitalea koreensis]|uniref:Exonuclease SbcC n=1 Tax=Solitalea koreensis TaxID=543615 RepID=A0A521EMI4_9SPHI|nr:SMC family ATPase [Solitalea koreensis]SMO84320.1 exonuclease SbcC [Solitalea koreensis]